MVLESLINYYEILKSENKVPLPGYSTQKIHYELKLNKNGTVNAIESALETLTTPKGKEIQLPRQVTLPFFGSRTSGISPYFAWEKAAYMFGITIDADKERTVSCFEAFKKHQHEVLTGHEDEPVVSAFLKFLDIWSPLDAEVNPFIEDKLEDLTKSNLVVSVEGKYLHENKVVKDCWNAYYQQNEANGLPVGVSIITGKRGPVALTHPQITGFPGAQSSGAALVSFNLPCVSAEKKKQGENAPMTPYEAFAYTTALKYMLKNNGVFTLGQESIFVWSETESDACQYAARRIVNAVIYGTPKDEDDGFSVRDTVARLAEGEMVRYHGTDINPDAKFYLLGIQPNSARLSVRFFYEITLREIVENVFKFYEDTEVAKIGKEEERDLTLYSLLAYSKRMEDKSGVEPELLEQMIKAAFIGGTIPRALLDAYNRRFKSTRDVKKHHAAVIKGYFRRSTCENYPKEVLDMALNKESDDQAYILGRLFFILERLQIEAIPKIQKTIRDKYIYSASVTPACVFPLLIQRSEYYITKLKKLDEKRGFAIGYENQITELLNRLDTPYPACMGVEQQSRFLLGYYHQKAYHFTPKEKKSDGIKETEV